MNKIIPVLGTAVCVAVSFMAVVYSESKSFLFIRPHVMIGQYDETESKITLMMFTFQVSS
ncbi:MAG: hypothetical protein GKS07_09200 [Nitrosopumilus sp.]|nr:MAG: hypothetical protein GKS07_09200 [Nitrosopumilus sp.]